MWDGGDAARRRLRLGNPGGGEAGVSSMDDQELGGFVIVLLMQTARRDLEFQRDDVLVLTGGWRSSGPPGSDNGDKTWRQMA